MKIEGEEISTLEYLLSKQYEQSGHLSLHAIIWTQPDKNVTWNLMKIPCHFPSLIDGSFVQIDTNFHGYFMSSIQVLLVFHAKT